MAKKANQKRPVLWECYTDTQLRIWPENNPAVNFQGQHRISVYMPQSIYDSKRGITMAPQMPIDILGKFQILNMGTAEHTNGYYHSRVNKDFYDIIIVRKGTMFAKGSEKKHTLKKKEVLILPPNRLCDTYVETPTSLFWIHLANNARWKSRLGEEIFTHKMNFFDEISSVMNMYAKEIFATQPSLLMLERIAEIFILYLEKEFPYNQRTIDIEKWILAQDAENGWDINAAAEYFLLDKHELLRECKKRYGLSFAKLVSATLMNKAIDMLRCGIKNTEIAKQLGYSDAYAFSKAFKNHFGKSPKLYLK